MQVFELNRSEYGKIRPLWEALNRLHHRQSTCFKAHFDSFTFEARMARFHARDLTAVFAAGEPGGELAAYCMASVGQAAGEVDSLYVDPAFRGRGLGQSLMDLALAWLEHHGCTRIRISVAQGNEQALGFYEKFGFCPRFTVLERPG